MSAGEAAKQRGLHVGVVLDGNRRWARERGALAPKGHSAGFQNFRKVAKAAAAHPRVRALTAFALSTENLKRSALELQALFKLFSGFARAEAASLQEEGIRVRIIGDLSRLPTSLAQDLGQLEKTTANIASPTLEMALAVAFGGRDEIVRAAKAVASSSQELTEESIGAALDSAPFGDMDLLIRTGGRHRISNFLLWSSAYAEIHFSPKMWPDFSPDDFCAAVDALDSAGRTFGK